MAEADNTRKPPRSRAARTPPVNPARFADEVRAALAAFRVDVSYAVAMANAAVTITRKRAVWAARRDLRTAERAAHTECRQAHPFRCHAVAPCGVGECKYATGELTLLDVESGDGVTTRPQADNTGPYTLTAAVPALLALRGGR